jgi:hypothetical protein
MALFLGCCTAVLLRYRKGRLAADAMHLLERSEQAKTPAVIPFPGKVEVGSTHVDLARVSGLTLSEAEDVLDWLEQNGFEDRNLLCESGSSFTVEFRMDTGNPPAPAVSQIADVPKRRNSAAG